MSYYKVGCNWGTGAPDFFEMLKEHSIVICNTLKLKKGDYVAIAQGYTIVALAQATSEKVSCTSRPELKEEFEKYSIDYKDDNCIVDAKIWELDNSHRFEYNSRRGIVKIQNETIQKKIHSLIATLTHINNEMIENFCRILEGNHNLILTGAPGTGKTHLAKEIAKEMGATYELVQFHPSYDYTDFVEGLRPVQNKNNIVFERRDGVFKEFCKRAI